MDLLLDTNVVIDICALRKPHVVSAAQAWEKAREQEDTVWIYAGALQTMQYVLALELRRLDSCADFTQQHLLKEASRRLHEFASECRWLPALSTDSVTAFEQDDPEDAQLISAIKRLGKDSRILTRDTDIISKCKQAITPEDYLALPHKPKQMQFIDLDAQQRRIQPQLEEGIHRVLHHGKYIMGPEVQELEEKMAEYVGVKHCISCASGTDALLMPLMAKGIGPGDAIFTTPFTFIATAEVIALLGATPVFVDIDSDTYNIDPDKLRFTIEQFKAGTLPNGKSSTGLTARGIIPVNLFGLPADYDRIDAVAKEHGLFVLEDAAQSMGAEYKGRKSCSLGDVAATSFFPAKPLGCYGDGGAIFTNDDDLAEIMKSIRVHGKGDDKYDNVRVGLNGRMDTMQAAVVLAKLTVFDEEIRARQMVANRYNELLEEKVKVPYVPEGYRSAWAQYTLRSDNRAQFFKWLKNRGVPSAIYYPKPLHLQNAFNFLGQSGFSCLSNTENAAKQAFSLPMYPRLTYKEQQVVINCIKDEWSSSL